MLVMIQVYAHKNGKYTVITAFSVYPVDKCYKQKLLKIYKLCK